MTPQAAQAMDELVRAKCQKAFLSGDVVHNPHLPNTTEYKIWRDEWYRQCVENLSRELQLN